MAPSRLSLMAAHDSTAIPLTQRDWHDVRYRAEHTRRFVPLTAPGLISRSVSNAVADDGSHHTGKPAAQV